MTDRREKARAIIRQILRPDNAASMEKPPPKEGFGREFASLAMENVYEPLWTRDGLSLKERSLVTIGILIGMRADTELRSHFAIGLRNGLTPQQLEEIVYHATGYAGFPAASHALRLAKEAVDQHAA